MHSLDVAHVATFDVIFMTALCNRAGHYIFALWFLSSIFFLLSIFSSHNLSRRRLDVCHTSAHGVASSANLGCRSETCCTRLPENTGRKNDPSGHHRTTLSGYIFAIKARIHNRNKLLNSNTSSTCPRNMVNFGPL